MPRAWPARDAPVLQDGLAVTFQPAVGGSADRRTTAFHVVCSGWRARVRLPRGHSRLVGSVIHLDLRDRFVFGRTQRQPQAGAQRQSGMEATGTGGMTDQQAHPPQLAQQHAQGDASPEKDAFFRLYWSTPDYGNEPISPKYLKHAQQLGKGRRAAAGRQLAAEHRCFKCRDAPGKGMPGWQWTRR